LTAPVQNQISCFFGRKGSGKTTLVGRYLEHVDRFVVCDTLNEYACGKIFTNLGDFARYAKKQGAGPIRAVVRFGSDDEFERLARMVQVIGETSGDILFVIEEADIRCSPQFIPPAMDQLIRYGRHWNVSLVAVSRRPAEISRHFTAQADTIIAGQTYEPRDLDFFRARCGEEFASKVSALPRYQFALWGEKIRADRPRKKTRLTENSESDINSAD